MTARDEAIKAMSDFECGPSVDEKSRQYHEWRMRDLLDAIPPTVLARFAIEQGALELAGHVYRGDGALLTVTSLYRVVEP